MPKLDESGFSIMEVVIALGIGGIVMIGLSQAMIHADQNVTATNIRSELETTHFVALQQSRNIGFLSKQMGIVTATGTRANAQLDRCLANRKKSADACGSFADATPRPISTVMTAPTHLQGANITSLLTAQLGCGPTNCDRVHLRLATTLQAGTMTLSRATEAILPAALFTAFEQIDFACAQGGLLLTEVNLATRTGRCDTVLPTGSTCPASAPMRSFGNGMQCQSTVNATCGSGMSSIGLFSGSQSCTSVSLM